MNHLKQVLIIIVLAIVAAVVAVLMSFRGEEKNIAEVVNQQAVDAQAQAAADAERIRQTELTESANPFKDRYQNPFE